MATKIFVNLPVRDLRRSMAFFAAMGFPFNKQFTDDTAACAVLSDDSHATPLTYAKFQDSTRKDIADAALAAGGTAAREPMDYGVTYGRSFQDPDGRIREVIRMDPSLVQAG